MLEPDLSEFYLMAVSSNFTPNCTSTGVNE